MRALLVVDVQNDFCPGGRLAVPDGDAIIPKVNRLAEHFEHIFLTQDWHPPGHSSFASSHQNREPYDTIDMPYGPQILWPDHCVQGTTGADFHPELAVDKAELIIRKGFRKDIDSYSAFFENDHHTRTGLAGFLRERDIQQLYIGGLATDFCVHWSAVDGQGEGFECIVIIDATRGIDTNGSMETAMQRMKDAGVRFVSTGEALNESRFK